MYDVIIIGAGAAGITAGIYSKRAGMNTVIFEKMGVGGQILLTDKIENYPGFPSISGPDLMDKFERHAEKFSVKIEYEEVKAIKLKGKIYSVVTDSGEYEAITVIIASGSSPRKLNVEGEEKFAGRGISYCAVCDGPFFKAKDVAVIGGGDAAIKESLYLAQIVNKVTVVHRRDKLRAEKINQDMALANPKIDFIWDSVVEKVAGNDKLNGIIIKNVKDPDKKSLIKVDGVFVYIGYKPKTDFIDVEKTSSGTIKTDNCMRTSLNGVFAAGDCRDTCLRQIATCVGDGAFAAYNAENYVEIFKSKKA